MPQPVRWCIGLLGLASLVLGLVLNTIYTSCGGLDADCASDIVPITVISAVLAILGGAVLGWFVRGAQRKASGTSES